MSRRFWGWKYDSGPTEKDAILCEVKRDRVTSPEQREKVEIRNQFSPYTGLAVTEMVRFKSQLGEIGVVYNISCTTGVFPSPLHANVDTPFSSPTPWLLLTMSASLGYLTIGLVRGFSSPGVPSMQELSPHLVPDDDAVSWVSASPPLGAFLGSLVAGPMLQYIGRKKTLMMSSPMFILGWAAIALAQNYPVLLCARLFTGFCVGIVLPSAQVYVSECAHAEIRGILGSLPALFMAGGILVSYLLGAWLPWNLLAWASAIFPALLFFVMIPLPESPAWLLSKDRTKDADEALKWLHHQPRSVTGTIRLEMQRPSIFTVDPELITAESLPPSEKTPDEDPYSLKELLRRPVLVPFVLSFTLLIFQQVSGIDSIIFYTVTIFKASGSSLNEHLATIIVGLVQLLANFFSLFLIDRSGRRPLLLASGALMCLSMMAMGTHFYLQVHSPEISKLLGLLPIVSMIVFMIGFSVGYCSIPFLLMGELIPVKQRSLLSSVAGSLNLGTMFVVIKTYPLIEDWVGAYGAFWLYAALCLASCFFVLFLVPETKGKSLDEIEEYFEEKNRLRKVKNAMVSKEAEIADTNIDSVDKQHYASTTNAA
uniref:Major facilitator superfamily (MFS) profile domain-containing protein n=1 Tax=Timema bartmani TaxID=61472 RepID=A0A7R9EQ18_9NEOP|nr:unnamed protein product [Timema bartmani]